MNNDRGRILNSNTVRLERVFPAPIDRVFEYFSEPELLSKWLMPATLEPRVGGRIQLTSAPIPANVVDPLEKTPQVTFIRGLISHYDPPRLIAYSWNEVTYEVSTEVRFELEQRGEDVYLVLTHSRLPAAFMAAVAAGWHVNLEIVLALIKGETPGDFFARFNSLLEEYKLAVAAAGIIVAASSAPSALASADPVQDSLRAARATLLTKYDRTWKEADDLEYKIHQLEKINSSDSDKALNDLSRELNRTNDDLHKLDLEIRDLDKALI